jgi:hypothetical protein
LVQLLNNNRSSPLRLQSPIKLASSHQPVQFFRFRKQKLSTRITVSLRFLLLSSFLIRLFRLFRLKSPVAYASRQQLVQSFLCFGKRGLSALNTVSFLRFHVHSTLLLRLCLRLCFPFRCGLLLKLQLRQVVLDRLQASRRVVPGL